MKDHEGSYDHASSQNGHQDNRLYWLYYFKKWGELNFNNL